MDNLQENLQKHRARFLEIMDCQERRTRQMRLESLVNDMENCYGIPTVGADKINAFANGGNGVSDIYALYRIVKTARWR